jgi:hypothetical protein
VFFLGGILAVWPKKKPQCQLKKALILEFCFCKSHHILRERSHMLPYLDNEFLLVAKTRQHSLKNFTLLSDWPLAKFGSFLLWMIASPPTWQNSKHINPPSQWVGIRLCFTFSQPERASCERILTQSCLTASNLHNIYCSSSKSYYVVCRYECSLTTAPHRKAYVKNIFWMKFMFYI